MTEKEINRLKELGWIDINDTMPPLNEVVTVMKVIDSNHQEIWAQRFNTLDEIKESNITHWAKFKSE